MPESIRFDRLFADPPESWGLRGDPYLWDEMARELGSMPLPDNTDALADVLEATFLRLTGATMDGDEPVFVERYAHGGMSSGHVSPEFWRDEALCLLTERLVDLGGADHSHSLQDQERVMRRWKGALVVQHPTGDADAAKECLATFVFPLEDGLGWFEPSDIDAPDWPLLTWHEIRASVAVAGSTLINFDGDGFEGYVEEASWKFEFEQYGRWLESEGRSWAGERKRLLAETIRPERMPDRQAGPPEPGTVVVLFDPPPGNWEKRGDERLWNEMAGDLGALHLPPDASALVALLNSTFERLTGSTLRRGATVYVERYADDCRSGGEISADFWLYAAIPLLIGRFAEGTGIGRRKPAQLLAKMTENWKGAQVTVRTENGTLMDRTAAFVFDMPEGFGWLEPAYTDPWGSPSPTWHEARCVIAVKGPTCFVYCGDDWTGEVVAFGNRTDDGTLPAWPNRPDYERWLNDQGRTWQEERAHLIATGMVPVRDNG